MSSSSVTSSIRGIGSTPQSDSSSELTVYYASNNGGIRRAAATTVDQNNRKDRSVTFAKPLITNSREVEPFSDSFSSPILAGHPNMYPNLNGPAVCRICYSSENSGPKTGEPLISPCHCKGTMGLYHRTCLNKWLATANKSCCEICRFKFRIKRVKRSFWEYLRDEDSKAARRSLVTDILCFFLLTPLVLASSVVCALSAVHLMKEEYAERHNNNDGMGNGLHFEIAVGLLFLTAVLLIAYCIWLGITIIFHRKSLTSWQATHWNYSVADQLSLEESMLINASVGRIV